MHRTRVFIFLCLHFFYSTTSLAKETRLKDIIFVKGLRTNSLIGYGIVIGLAGTGDSASSVSSRRSVARMLTKMGVATTAEEVKPGSYASVIATAELPSFSRNGNRVDVRISTNGDAKSLAGGTLLVTPMKAGDDQVYVIAQGSVAIGGPSGVGTEVLSVARIPNGGVVEREFLPNIVSDEGEIILSLREPDFTTNDRVVTTINQHFRGFYAVSSNPMNIQVKLPEVFKDKFISFMSELENLTVQVERKAVVVVNERTGTIVLGKDVTIGPVTIAHGDLSINVASNDKNQKKGQGEVKKLLSIEGPTIGDLIEALNSLGVKPKDLVGILQSLNAAGSLNGDLRFL